MHNEGSSVHVSEEEVSGGSKEGVVRWVLIIGTLLAVVALSVIWITGAATNDPESDEISVSNQIANEQDAMTSDTDSIVTPPADPAAGEPSVENGLNVIPNADDEPAMPAEAEAEGAQ